MFNMANKPATRSLRGAKMKHYQYDKCPQCKEGTLETVEMKGEEYLACDECDFTHFEGD